MNLKNYNTTTATIYTMVGTILLIYLGLSIYMSACGFKTENHESIEVYTPFDIIYIYPEQMYIETESGHYKKFKKEKELSDYISNATGLQIIAQLLITNDQFIRWEYELDTSSILDINLNRIGFLDKNTMSIELSDTILKENL